LDFILFLFLMLMIDFCPLPYELFPWVYKIQACWKCTKFLLILV
jgi:hypothetical protein